MSANPVSKQLLRPLAIACALVLSPMAEAQSPAYPTSMPSSFSGLVWTAGGSGNWNTDTNWDAAVDGNGNFYVRDDGGPITDFDPVSLLDIPVYIENKTASPFSIGLTSNVQASYFSVDQGTVIINLNGFTLNVDNGGGFSPYVAAPVPGTLVFSGSGTVNINLGNQIVVGSGGAANNVFDSAAPSAPFPFTTAGGATVKFTLAAGATVTVGSEGGGINNSAILRNFANIGPITINSGSTTGASNNLVALDGGDITIDGPVAVNGSGLAGVNANNQFVVQNGANVSGGSRFEVTVADGSQLIVKGGSTLNNALGTFGILVGGGMGAASMVVQDGSTVINTTTGLSIGAGSGVTIRNNSMYNGAGARNGTTLAPGATIAVLNDSSFTGGNLAISAGGAATISTDKSSAVSFTGSLSIDPTSQLKFEGGGILSFTGGYSIPLTTDPTFRQVDTGSGVLSVGTLSGAAGARHTNYYLPVTGTLIIGPASGFTKDTITQDGGLIIGAGTNLQFAGSTNTANDGAFTVNTGGTLSGFAAFGNGIGIILNGGTFRVGSDSSTTGSIFTLNNGNALLQALKVTAPSTFAFGVYGFGGTGGSNTGNYDQLAIGDAANQLRTNGFTNTISLNLKMDNAALMLFEPGVNGDQFQFFTQTGSGINPGTASAAVNLGSVNFSYGTSAAQLASVGLAWDPDTTSFATTGLMGLKEVAWMQLNNGAPVDAATALTINNGIRSAADGFSGNGVNGTFLNQTVKGAGWSVTGSAANGTPIAAGGNLTAGTTAFAPGANTTLNGNYAGVVTANFDLGNGVQGSQTWNLSHKISGIVADSGQAGLVAGQSYAGFGLMSTRGTTATIVSGTASGDTTIGMSFVHSSNTALKSDVLTLSGITPTGSTGFHGVTLTDEYVLQLSVTPGTDASYYIAWFDAAANGGAGAWVNATSGDSDSTGDLFDGSSAIIGAYNGETTLGQYGYDPVTQTAWAVVDHGGDFAVTAQMVPEPGSWALIASALGIFLGFHRPRRGNAEAQG